MESKRVSVTQSSWIICDPIDSSLPGPSVHGTLQARILEWVVPPTSRDSSQLRELRSPALQVDSLPFEPAGMPTYLPAKQALFSQKPALFSTFPFLSVGYHLVSIWKPLTPLSSSPSSTTFFNPSRPPPSHLHHCAARTPPHSHLWTLLSVMWQPGWEENVYMCMSESLQSPHETVITLLIGYTTIQTKKFKIKERDQGANFEYVIWSSACQFVH